MEAEEIARSLAKERTKLIKVPASQLKIHPTAQRDLLPHRLKVMREEFDLDAIGVLFAVEYEINGIFAPWVIDGHHRHETLLYHGLGDWICDVIVFLDAKDEARASDLFLKLNYRGAVTPKATYLNALQARRKNAVGVHGIAEASGLRVTDQSADGNITCISTLLRLWDHDGGETLKATLDVLLKSWGQKAAAVEGKLVEGLGVVMRRYNGVIDKAALVKKLSKYPGGPSTLVGNARGLRDLKHMSISRCIAECIVDRYNTARHVKLDPL